MLGTEQNPLNKFRTFSYHFILGVANGTKEAIKLAKQSSDLSSFKSDGSKKILVHGARDNRFIIKSVEINSILNPNGAYSGESFYHTMNMEGKIIIQEPLGIRFYEEIREAAISFGTETTNMVFFLKPIFVGYNINGPSETISTVKPYLFLITQLTSVIDEGGAIYTLETFGVVNGASKLPQYQAVAGGFNLTIEKNETDLPEALNKLETSINYHFNIKRRANDAKLNQQRMRPGFNDNKIPIEYKFHLDDEYKNGKYIAGSNVDEALKDSANEKYIIHQGARAGIEELIRKIMNSCEAVINDRGVDSSGSTAISDRGTLIGDSTPTTKCYMYKIHSSIDLNTERTLINYYIYKYEVEFVPVESKKFPEPGAILEFDYIYTGKNLDIKEFQMNMKLGTLFFHTVYTSDNLHLNEPTGRGKQKIAASAQTGTTGILNPETQGGPQAQNYSASSNPVFDNEARHTSNPISTGSYYAMLKRFSALENLGVDLVIKGNPNLMDKSVFVPEDLENGGTLETIRKPLYIKMNIKFPENYTEPRKNFQKFWYDGAYYILTIKNVFDENGEFTQVIHMYAMHTDYYGDITRKDIDVDEEGFSSSGNYSPISSTLSGIVPTGDTAGAYQAAGSMLGKTEGKDDKELIDFLRAGGTGIKSTSTAWCAAFVNASLERSGIPGTGSLASRSFERWGNEVSLDQAKVGDVVVLTRGSDPRKGHVGFYAGRDANNDIKLLGGNQGDSVSIASYSAGRLVSVRRPNAPADYIDFAYNTAQDALGTDSDYSIFNKIDKINEIRGGITGETFKNKKFTPQQLSDFISPELDNIKKLKYEMEDLSGITNGIKSAKEGIASGMQVARGGVNSATQAIGMVQGGINSIKKEMERYKGIIGGFQQQIQQIQQVKQEAQGMIEMVKNQPIKLAMALDQEHKILKKLNIHPDNIINVINKKAPVLSKTWKTAEETLGIIKEKYEELQSTYNEVRSLYEQIANLPALLRNQAQGLKNQALGEVASLGNQAKNLAKF